MTLKTQAFLMMTAAMLLTSCAASRGGDMRMASAPAEADGGGGEESAAKKSLPKPGQLTAGEWRDHEHWGAWLDLMKQDWRTMTKRWGFDPVERVSVHVTARGHNAVDVPVILRDEAGQVLWRARTNNRGQAHLFPSMGRARQAGAKFTIDAGGVTRVTTPLEPGESDVYTLELDRQVPTSQHVDVLFSIDVTGSMHDERDYLRSEMRDVLQRVSKAQGDVKLRASFNFYCDPGDSFTVKSHPFTSGAAAIRQLERAPGCGGGDYPEAVDEGLEDAIAKHKWSKEARARLLFLVLDAPPHEDAASLTRLKRATERAAREGIQIIPVMSSGSNKPTEFLLRSLAIATHGSFVFLTDHSGIGNPHIKPTVGAYDVEYLNDLLVRVIVERATVTAAR